LEKMDKDIVLIEWVDSKGMERWEYLDEMEPMSPCVNLSLVVNSLMSITNPSHSIIGGEFISVEHRVK